MEAPKGKKLLGIKIRKATPAESELPTPEEEALTIIPSSLPASEVQPETSQAIRTFFKKTAVPISIKPVVSQKAPSGSKPINITIKPILTPLEPVSAEPVTKEDDYGEFQILADEILSEETKSPYTVPKPETGYVPQTHRSFSTFIKETYRQFALPPLPTEPDYDACLKLSSGASKAENYQYQQFVREYMSWTTPYRGVLVYHGLGSGKTCTAIAAAEALYSTANRRIIVMTPFSLRKNFIREITFCGFRHFRLQNHWISFPNDPQAHPMIRLFASKVLSIPTNYLSKAKRIWIPDFNQEPNYTTLSSAEQTEIREQIQQILIYDPQKKLNGRIWFINYNGITASRLKELACNNSNPFDNAVIVIDEIHNLIRLMQGTIEPYLVNLKGLKRKIPQEPITPEHWKPFLCGKTMNYKRGYILYRLLIGARNSKIIGLSGTPLINFPEELGILANVLHGYIHIAEGRVVRGKSVDEEMKIKEEIERIAHDHPYIDFYRVTVDDSGIRFLVTTLPEGIRKIPDSVGVERIPLDETSMSFQSAIESFKSELDTHKIQLVAAIRSRSEPLLPPVNASFQERFFNTEATTLMDTGLIKNRLVLLKRLSGLVSYYKGSRKDLMPAVTKDEIVRVPMSPYQQDRYSRVRLEEIDIEEKMKDKKQEGLGAGKLGTLWAEIYEIRKLKQSSNYRMGSRQACNFVFPPNVSRPRPRTQAEAEQEVGIDVEEIVDELPQDTAIPDEPDNMSELLEEEEAEKGAADKEDEAAVNAETEQFLIELEAQLRSSGMSDAEVRETLTRTRAQIQAEKAALLLPSAQEDTEAALTQELTLEEKRCRKPMGPSDSYRDAIAMSKQCLVKYAQRKLEADAPEGLSDLSPKFKAMIEKIKGAKGSSLVYSQFLEMEGIGIFTIVMRANGFEPIVIEMAAGGAQFSAETIQSLRKGPQANQPRFITFTGGESEEVRRYAVDVFNAKFSELPKAMADVLRESGYLNNQKGDLCRVFCITSAGAEGLSLKNVRAVHLMEPYWNDVRMSQVKGRAVRICSHMDIQPPSERTVEIFTYISVFSQEAQIARTGPKKIAEAISMKDSISTQQALAMKVPVPQGAQGYTYTSDEHLWFIAEGKKAMIDSLSRIMKSAAVDCQLNFNENNDGTFTCALFGKVGDFMYHPDIDIDIAETNDLYGNDRTTLPLVSQTAPAKSTRKILKIKMGDKAYVLASVTDPVSQKVIRYDIFLPTDTLYQNPVGEVQVDEVTGGPKKGTARFKQ
jgi:hypothetical protein